MWISLPYNISDHGAVLACERPPSLGAALQGACDLLIARNHVVNVTFDNSSVA